MEEGAIEELVDPRLGNRYLEPEVLCLMHAASLCIRRDPLSRPRMSQVYTKKGKELDIINVSKKATPSTH